MRGAVGRGRSLFDRGRRRRDQFQIRVVVIPRWFGRYLSGESHIRHIVIVTRLITIVLLRVDSLHQLGHIARPMTGALAAARLAIASTRQATAHRADLRLVAATPAQGGVPGEGAQQVLMGLVVFARVLGRRHVLSDAVQIRLLRSGPLERQAVLRG